MGSPSANIFQINETENVARVNQKLREIFKKKNITKPINIWDINGIGDKGCDVSNCIGVGEESKDEINIWLEPSLSPSLIDAVYVHEVLHIILSHEGFPTLEIETGHLDSRFIDIKEKFANEYGYFFKSKFEHPEIYYRMRNEYNLDLEEYFEMELTIYKKFLESPDVSLGLKEQLAILLGLESSFFDDTYKARAWEMIDKKYPGTIDCSKDILKAALLQKSYDQNSLRIAS